MSIKGTAADTAPCDKFCNVYLTTYLTSISYLNNVIIQTESILKIIHYFGSIISELMT